jgi:arylsulfatase A-like enzyme
MIGALLILALLATQGEAPEPSGTVVRPNVIVVLVDDLGWADLGCQGSRFYETPHIDRLAREGLRFTDGYAAAAVCSPTRAALMTGKHPARLGITDWIRASFQGGKLPADGENPSGYAEAQDGRLACPRNPLWLELEERTIAEHLGAAGYATGHIGKWHLGLAPHFPEHQGFDENFGGCDYGQPPSYFDPFANERLDGIASLPPREEGQYLTDREGDEALGFIRRHKDERFFLSLCHYAVHTPIQGREDYTAHFRAKANDSAQDNAVYAAMVRSVDDQLGRVLALLEELELDRLTLIVFTSDNGGLLGPTNNAPLRSGKGHPYEGGIRVPWIVRWPGMIAAGRTSTLPIVTTDVLPTLLDVCGLPAAEGIDGVSFAPELREASEREPRPLIWHFPHYRHGVGGPYTVLRFGRWKLLRFWEGPRHELYDLESDLGERTDLAAEQPERVGELSAKLDAELARLGASTPR